MKKTGKKKTVTDGAARPQRTLAAALDHTALSWLEAPATTPRTGRGLVRASAAGGSGGTKAAEPRALLRALVVVASPHTTDDAKATALDKLTDHFSALLDAESKKTAMSSALAQVKALTERIAKVEKASAIGARASSPPSRPRQPPMAKDRVVEEIERAERNTLRTLAGRRTKTEQASAVGAARRAPSGTASRRGGIGVIVDVAMIEAAGRNVLRTLPKK